MYVSALPASVSSSLVEARALSKHKPRLMPADRQAGSERLQAWRRLLSNGQRLKVYQMKLASTQAYTAAVTAL